MNRIKNFIGRERLYLLLLVFIALSTFVFNIPDESKVSEKTAAPGLFMARADIEKVLEEKKDFAAIYSLVSVLVCLILVLGIVIDVILLSGNFFRTGLSLGASSPDKALWDAWDVARVVILFLFFGYMIVLSESALLKIMPALRNKNLRAIINSSALDVTSVIFILYFTVGKYGQNLASLGISAKNFFKNVFYGIAGYIAALPALFAILAATAVFASLINYVPEKQFVVELFLKEKDSRFLIYTSLFAAIAGPVAEELFFRGFMYGAFKKYMHKIYAMLITAALFSALHAHPIGFLPIMSLGLLLVYLYERTGTLVASITVHAIHNLTMLSFVFLVRRMGI